jgi:hypothetical protein
VHDFGVLRVAVVLLGNPSWAAHSVRARQIFAAARASTLDWRADAVDAFVEDVSGILANLSQVFEVRHRAIDREFGERSDPVCALVAHGFPTRKDSFLTDFRNVLRLAFAS